MKVCILAAPVGGLTGLRIRAIGEQAWRAIRPSDELHAFHISGEEGDSSPSGLADVIGGAPEGGEGPWPRRDVEYVWASEQALLLDYTELLGHAETSAIVGDDLVCAARQGYREVICALPWGSTVRDGGLGMLARCAGQAAEARELPSGLPESGAFDEAEIGKLVANAREALGGMRITALVPGEQRLTGFHGLARAMMREGMDSVRAQEYERAYGALAEALSEAAVASPAAALLHDAPDRRGAYAGVAGGLAFALACIGARTYPIGDVTVRSRCGEAVNEAELVVYIAGHIGANLPSGLIAAIDVAGEAPVVLIYDEGAIAPGELAALGLAGAYELRPERSFSRTPTATDAQVMAEVVEAKVKAVARTWGY